MKSVKEYLKNNTLLFDGSMGTYFSSKTKSGDTNCELANITNPEIIKEIHEEYIKAGCKAIKTNTFAAQLSDEKTAEKIIKNGIEIARSAAGNDVYVFADIGPVKPSKEENIFTEYKKIVDIFLFENADNFLFETLSTDSAIGEIAQYIKNKNKNAFIIASFAVSPDGFTREGIHIRNILKNLSESKSLDAVGLNCVSGAKHMLELIQKLDLRGLTFSVMPNAGYPTVIHNRTFYKGTPEYFAAQMAQIAANGVKILGGCCGTTPLHINETYKAIANKEGKAFQQISYKEKPANSADKNAFFDKMQSGKKVIAVELDPPQKGSCEKFLNGAKELKEAGIDILTIADCPIARARMDSSILACMVKSGLNLDTLPHMTCRDRNLNATKALLLGTYANGIRNILAVTGDPIPSAERKEVQSVYQFNSRKLAAYISSLCEDEFETPFKIFGALNINALNFDMQIKLAKQKIENGMCGFLTQPVLTQRAFENIQRAKAELNAKILGGIIPVVSEKNAVFMNSEINGINVCEEIINMHKSKTREESEIIAKDTSVEIAKKISPYVDGYYVITPFSRTTLVSNIVKEIKNFE